MDVPPDGDIKRWKNAGKTGLNLLTFCCGLCYFKFRYQGVVHTGFLCCAGRHHAAG